MTIAEQPTVASIARKRRPWQFSLLRLLIFMVCLSLVFAFLHQVISAYRDTMQLTHRSICEGHLKYLALALHNYHDHYGSFPPAYIADSAGKPMHSWRVLILPFMDERDLYAKYDFREPWNGPNNIELAGQMPRAFCCSWHDEDRARGLANYVAVVGADTCWPGAGSISFRDITDDPDSTLLIAEAEGGDILWLEPRDLQFDQLSPEINPRGKTGISSLHRRGANIATAAGYVRWLNQDETTPARLKALLTIAGND